MNKIASFNRFEIEFPAEAVADCSHSGDDVAHWATRITRPKSCTVKRLRAELEEYGAWDALELTDDATNWKLIIWIAAGNLKE